MSRDTGLALSHDGRIEWTSGSLVLAYASLGPVAVFASNATVIVLLVTLVAVPAAVASGLRWQALSNPLLGIGLVTIAVWIVVSTAWAPGLRPLKVLSVIAIMAVGTAHVVVAGRLASAARRPVENAVIIGGALALGLMAIELLTRGAMTQWIRSAIDQPVTVEQALVSVARASAVMVPLAWPIGLGIAARSGRLWTGGLFIAAVGAVTFHLPLAASFAALTIGAAAFALAYALPRGTLICLGLLFAAYAIAAPSLAANLPNLGDIRAVGLDLTGSGAHRLEIWRYVSNLSAENALVGHGFDASRAIGRTAPLADDLADQGVAKAYLLPLHPHNATLQVWLELGVVGTVASVLIVVGILRAIWLSTTDRLAVAAAVASLVSFLTIASLSFGVWQSWWHATAWLAAGIVVLFVRGQHDRTRVPLPVQT